MSKRPEPRRSRARPPRARQRRAGPGGRGGGRSRRRAGSAASCTGEDMGLFIGRHGQTIDAVQHLAFKVAGARPVAGAEGGGRRGRLPRPAAAGARAPGRPGGGGRRALRPSRGARRDERTDAGSCTSTSRIGGTSRRIPRAPSPTDTRRRPFERLRVSRETLPPDGPGAVLGICTMAPERRRETPPLRRPGSMASLVARYELPADAGGPGWRRCSICSLRPTAPTSVHDPEQRVSACMSPTRSAGLEVPGAARQPARSPISARAAGCPGSCWRSRSPRRAGRARRNRPAEVRVPACRGDGDGGGERRGGVWARAEEWADGGGRCDVVTARALAALAVLGEYAAPLLRPAAARGWKGAVDRGGGRGRGWRRSCWASVGAGPLRGALRGLRAADAARSLRKIGPTPTDFPRRPGMATKRPLSATNLR